MNTIIRTTFKDEKHNKTRHQNKNANEPISLGKQ